MDPERFSAVYSIKRRLRKGHSEDVFSQFVDLGGRSAAAAIITFILHLLMARILGPEQYAEYGTYVAILFTVFFCLTSIHLIITRFVSYHRSRYQYEQINYIVTHAIRYLFAAGFVAFILLVIASKPVSSFFGLENITSTVILGFVLWFTMMMPVYEGAYKGLEEFSKLGKLRITEAVLRILIVTLFVLLGFGVSGALFGLGLGTFVALALSYKHLYRLQKLKMVRPNTQSIRRFSIPVVITMISVALILNIDIILVKHFFTSIEAGVFAAASLLVKVPFLVSMVFVSVMFHKITKLHMDGKNSSAVLKTSLYVVVPLVALFTLIGLLLGGPLFSLLFGSGYDIGMLIGFYAFGMGCLAISILFIIYLLGIRKDKISFALPLFVIGYLALLLWMHSSLLQVVLIVMFVNAVLFAYSLWIAREEIDFDYFF